MEPSVRLCAAAILCVCLWVCAEEKSESPVPQVEGGASIDGALNEPFWAKAQTVRGDYINSKKGVLSDEPRLTIKYAWDEHYLYIGYETFDKNLIAKPSGVKEGPDKNKREGCEIWSADPKEKVDVVEFFISFGDERFFWEIHHNAANQFNDVWCTVADPAWPIAKSSLLAYGILFNNKEFIADDGDFTTAFAVKMKPKADGTASTVNSSDDTDAGYTAELRLPWGGIGAPAAARPDPKKRETSWKMEGQKLLILAVVQDGDLKERYHHSSPLRSGDWFHKTAALWPRYILSKAASGPEKKPAFFDLENATASELAAELIQRMDRQEHYADLIQPTVDRGMAAALACAEGLSLDKQERIEPLYGIIAMAARCRRAHPELLKLYDPLAYEVFYTEAGVESQKRFALALKLKAWTPRVLEALINAAPRPTLEWLKEQAGAQHPEIEKACRMLKEWSTHVYFKRESQCVDELRSIILKLAACERFSADPGVYAVLIRCAGETGASEMSPLALKALSHSDVSVRAEACTALQRFGGERMPAELLSLAGREHEPRVLIRLAEALEAWHDDESAGEAALNIFKRCKDAEVRRALLFSCMHAEWPARTALLLEAFNDAECRNNGVLGVALQAVAMHSADELEKQTLKLTTEYQTAPAPLIEALGAVNDEASANYLAAALKTSKNISVRLKIFLSLEKNESAIARAALLNELKSTTDPLLAQQLVAIAGRIKLPHAESVLLSLAADTTAPLPVRVQCLWSLGAFRSADVRQKLERLHAQADVLFSSGEGSDSGTLEKVEQARMLLKMALLEQGDAAAETELAALFDTATPSTRISMLMLLSSSKRDHAVIQRGLHSADFAVVLAAIHAASAANPQKYHREFLRLKDAPFLTALLKTGLDLNDMPEVLDGAIAAGK